MDFVITSITFLLILLPQCLGFWHHKDPDGKSKWHILYRPACNGTKQSPVDINTFSVITDNNLLDFTFKQYDIPVKNGYIFNSGHSVQFELREHQDKSIQIASGGLPNAYIFEQFHLHWGKTSDRGSEHTINKVEYPGELHLVHFSNIYKSIGEALTRSNGLAVLGMLFEISEKDNPKLNNFFNYLDKVKYRGELAATMNDIVLKDFLPDKTDVYYRYDGSLTTPLCDESVIWTVFREKIPISERQIQRFRDLSEANTSHPFVPLDDNYRDTQPLNGRKIKLSKSLSTDSGNESVNTSMVVILICIFSSSLWH